MSRIAETFEKLQGRRAALVGYVTGGFPSLEGSLDLARALLRHCDLLEIGLPFSDPVMDGPILQETSRLALQEGFRPGDVCEMARRLRQEGCVKPLLVMTYYNPLLRFGHAAFATQARQAGIDGVIVPDLPPEEAEDWLAAAWAAELDNIPFVAPNTPPARIAGNAAAGGGFLYCIASLGITGTREHLDDGLAAYARRVREHASLPLVLGIGISTPQQCAQAGHLADGVVVASAFMREYRCARDAGAEPLAAVEAVETLAGSMRTSLQR
jgi:tryptophan synthase alpha chain